MAFSDIPVRENDQRIDASWFNSLRTAGVSAETVGSIPTYADDSAYVTGKGSAAADGDIYYNTTSDLLRYYSNGAWSNVVDEDSVQDVVNKSMVDASTTFEDDGDGTKKMKMELSGITTATTRTVTYPDKDGTMAMTSDLHTQNTDTGTNANTFTIGDNADTDKKIEADTGAANNPAIKYNTTDDAWEFSNDGTTYAAFGSGSGAGSLDTFYTDDFETDGVTNYTSGQSAGFDGGGVLDGTLASGAGSQLAGDDCLKYTMSTSSTNDWVASPSITIEEKQQNQTVGLTFYYTYDGADDDLKVVGWDDTNNTQLTLDTDYLKAASKSQRFSVQFPIPDTCNAIKWGVQVVTGNNTKILLIDDVEISTNPIVYKDSLLQQQLSVHALGSALTASGAAAVVRWGTVTESGDSLLSYDDSNGRFTANQDCHIVFTSSARSASSGNLDLRKNGTFESREQIIANNYANASTPFYMAKDDYIDVYVSVALAAANTQHLEIHAYTESEHIVAYNSRNAENSMIRLHTGNGHGGSSSGETHVRNFSTVVTNTGNAITYTPRTTTTGDYFTINEDGVYFISYSDNRSGGGSHVGLSLNSTQLSTSVINITAADALAIDTTAASGFNAVASWNGLLETGDIVRAHTDSLPDGTGAKCNFTIAKIGVGDLLGVPKPRVAYVKDVKANTTEGGGYTTGSWATRTLNTLEGDQEFISLSANQVTLSKGKYSIHATVPAYQISLFTTKLRNITDSTDDLIGNASLSNTAEASQFWSFIDGEIEITSSKTFEVQITGSATNATNGMGRAAGRGVNEIYTTLRITKLA